MESPATDAATIERIIRARQTTKVFADEPLGNTTDRLVIEQLIASAAWAPFHLPSAEYQRTGKLDSQVPWRFYVLDVPACQSLREYLIANGDTGKLPRMLAAATAMIQATWLPNRPTQPSDALFEPTLANMEHIAAASAAVQNLLLVATARGIPTYWSSGGALREPAALDYLGISPSEIPLGSVFLFPENLDGLKTAPGKLRDKRGTDTQWARWVDLDRADLDSQGDAGDLAANMP